MKKYFLTLILTIVTCTMGWSWGQKGHDTVAYIAQQHLTDKTKAAIDSLLDGYSIVYWANWLDNASHTPEYAYAKTWHYKNIDPEFDFDNAPIIPEGNIVDAIYEQVDVLSAPENSDADKALALKMVVHFLGDLHQPMHMGRAVDRGGNSHTVTFFKKPTNLHSVWDTNILESAHAWSHTEWQEEIDRLSPAQVNDVLAEGNPVKWGKETYQIATEIYDTTPQGTNIEYDYIANWTPTIENQLVKGGLRLADVLNSVFDPGYEPQNNFVKK